MNPFNLLMVLQTLVDFFEGYFLQQLYHNFFEGRFQKKIWTNLGVMIGYVIFQYCKKLILPADYRMFHIAENLILTCFFLLFLVMCFYKNVGAISVFLIVSFMAIQDWSRILTLIFPYLSDLLTNILCQHVKNHHFFFTILIVDVVWILAYLIRILIMYLSLKRIRDCFNERHFCIHSVELQFLLIPGLTSLSISILLNLIMFRVGEGGRQEFLFDVYPVLRLFLPVMLVLSLLSILYGVKLFQDMILLNRERNRRVVLEKQIKSMQEYMEETRRVQSGIRSMKHDMKNTLAVIMQLTSNEKGKEELSHYLSGFNQTVSSLEYRFHTGNTVVDALLNMKYHEIMFAIPDLKVDTDELLFPDMFTIESYDMGIIVGNALDNAIEACKKLKMEKPEEMVYVKLSSYQKRTMFFLEVENNFNGTLILDRTSEFPISDKEHGEIHGMGLANIKYAAEKYHGAVEWEVRGMIFVLAVMLKNG